VAGKPLEGIRWPDITKSVVRWSAARPNVTLTVNIRWPDVPKSVGQWIIARPNIAPLNIARPNVASTAIQPGLRVETRPRAIQAVPREIREPVFLAEIRAAFRAGIRELETRLELPQLGSQADIWELTRQTGIRELPLQVVPKAQLEPKDKVATRLAQTPSAPLSGTPDRTCS
jgi:hypothetical protein